MAAPPNEPELIERAQHGDKEAISTLYQTYAQVVFQYISYRVESDATAEDLTADVFLRMVRGLPAYKLTGAPFSAWLYRIAANRITDFYRSHESARLEPIPEHYGSEVDLADDLADEEERSRLQKALAALPEDYQTVLILRFMQDMPHAEVAAILGKSVEAVRVLQHRALKALAAHLSEIDSAHHERGEHHGG